MRVGRLALGMSAVLCLGVASCAESSQQGTSRSYAEEGTFTIAVNYDVGKFDPYHNGAPYILAPLAYDKLANRQLDGTFVSGLAQDWTVTPRVAEFKLRADVTCSDGSPLTASQVAKDINYVSDPKNQSYYYGALLPTIPLKATADDATRTVKVVPSEPFGFLLQTVGQLPIMCAAGLSKPGSLATASSGTGPFVLTAATLDQTYTFTRRPGYTWGPDGASNDAPGTPSKVVVRVVKNESTATNLLLSGEVNAALVGGPDGQRLVDANLQRREVPTSGAWLWFNQRSGRPGSERDVRAALTQAVDFQQVIKVNTGGTGRAATGLVNNEPKVCPGDTVAGQFPGFSQDEAAAALDKAGWAAGADGVRTKDGKPLTIDLHLTATGPFERPTAELIAGAWRAVGADVTLSEDSAADYYSTMYETGDWDVYIAGFGFDLPSQYVSRLAGPLTPEGRNLAAINNPAYKSLADQAQQLTPPAACEYWNKAEQALWREVNPVPIVSRPWIYFFNRAEAQMTREQLIPTSIRVFA
jgi:peptide/nickel transport system substrate-binding protein